MKTRGMKQTNRVKYQTPSCCYKKAPVRRETILERDIRRKDQPRMLRPPK